MGIPIIPNPSNKMCCFFVVIFFSPHLEMPQNKMKKLGQELFAVGRLLEEFENCIGQQKEQLKHLKVK